MKYRFVGGPVHGKIYDVPEWQRTYQVAVATRPMVVGEVLDPAASFPIDRVEYELRLAEMSGNLDYRRNGEVGWRYREWYFSPAPLPGRESERLLATLPPPWQAGL